MGELLGEILKFIVQLIVELIIYIVFEILGYLIVVPMIDYFFGRTRWFSLLYVVIAGVTGVQIYRLQIGEDSSSVLYSFLATIIVLALAPLLHVRIAALISALSRSSPVLRGQKDL